MGLLWRTSFKISCRFGIHKHLLSDNGPSFYNMHVKRLVDDYRIEHVKSSPYYPQEKAQTEATNKTRLHILTKMVYEKPIGGIMFSLSPCGNIISWSILQLNPRLSLLCKVVSVEVMVPSARLALASKLDDPHQWVYDMEALEEMRHK